MGSEMCIRDRSSTAEVTSCGSWYPVREESSAFRRLGCARLGLRPVSTQLRSSWWIDSDDEEHRTVPHRQQDDELEQKTATTDGTGDDSSHSFDSPTSPHATVNDRASNLDRIANVSVHYPCSSAAAQLARRLRAAQRNVRRIGATNTTRSLAPHQPSVQDDGDQLTSFDAVSYTHLTLPTILRV